MKKTFKKMVAVTTGLVLALGMSVGVAADTDTDLFFNGYTSTSTITNKYDLESKTSSTRDVKVNFTQDDTKVYRVDVEWGSLVFDYTFADDSIWNPDTHTYGTENGTWSNNGSANIIVTNHSNASISYAAKFGTNDSITTNGVKATLSDNTGNIGSAVGTKVAEAPSKTIGLVISGKPIEEAFKNNATSFKVGTVTVTITAPASTN